MRTKLFLATILLLAPLPALADVTARYAVGGKELVVEVDDGGNSRIGVDGKFAIIRRDGTDYIAISDKEGPKVFELQAMIDLFKGILPKSKEEEADAFEFALAPGAAVAIAGQQGNAWNLVMVKGDDESKKKHIEMVMSADPALEPVGTVFRRSVASLIGLAGAMFPEKSGFTARLTELFDKGALLRVRPVDQGAEKPEPALIEFKSFDTAEIDAKHFELPAPVTSADEIFGAMGALMNPGGEGGEGSAIKNLP
ncbi:hypothetical protein P6144_06365 [Sphingomonas sp. HITSZ_GF]|uniref:hypothetical protein n=1 Tax=Sphingomonas sp. HITSZ_GF TaxID=3037247 RepID=UPI00240CF9CC|nr:hypothetical protein [Sphingomonas sp. HITSZ_GF]MDG2533263.1 hypothetical protein [Sphingomonas sp. HITSZ_GF]